MQRTSGKRREEGEGEKSPRGHRLRPDLEGMACFQDTVPLRDEFHTDTLSAPPVETREIYKKSLPHFLSTGGGSEGDPLKLSFEHDGKKRVFNLIISPHHSLGAGKGHTVSGRKRKRKKNPFKINTGLSFFS